MGWANDVDNKNVFSDETRLLVTKLDLYQNWNSVDSPRIIPTSASNVEMVI